MSRKFGGLRRGDGSFCGAMAEAMLKGYMVPCNVPPVKELHRRYGVEADRNYPEPVGGNGQRLYRYIGNWPDNEMAKLDAYRNLELKESVRITTIDQLLAQLKQGKPCFVCSMEAIHKVGTHRDGFSIHARNPRNSWAHNMCFAGLMVASDGEVFIRESNQSWGIDMNYNRRVSEVADSFNRGRLTVQSIGEFGSPESEVPTQ